MPRRRSLVNRSAVRSRFASAGFRTSEEVLDHLEATISSAVKAGIKGMLGRGRKTVTAEDIERGKFFGDPTAQAASSKSGHSRHKVNRGLLRR